MTYPPTAPTGLAGETLPTVTTGARSYGWWGMVWLIATEAAFFALLIVSYVFIRFRHTIWPPPPIPPPDLGLPLAMSAVLWASSIPVAVAERAARSGDRRRLRAGLLGGFVLGTAFLATQVFVEYPRMLEDLRPTTNAYGSLFFLITGFHGFHLAVGLLLSLWTQIRAWAGAFDEHRHAAVQIFALYWHFVDVVWLFVLLTVYVFPHV